MFSITGHGAARHTQHPTSMHTATELVTNCSLHAELQCIMFQACHPEISEATVKGMILLLCSVSLPLGIIY